MDYDEHQDDAIKHTKKIESTMPSSKNIGETAKALYFTLSMKKNNYEILSARLEDD